MLAVCSYFPASYAQTANAQDKAPVSGAFLEYLAELVEVNGQLVHPADIAKTTDDDKAEEGLELRACVENANITTDEKQEDIIEHEKCVNEPNGEEHKS